MPLPNHFSSALVSNWQSAVAKVSSRASADMLNLTHAELAAPQVNFDDPMLHAATLASQAQVNSMTGQAVAPPANAIEMCARAALAVAMDRVRGDSAAVIRDGAILKPFGGCDPKWVDCITDFVAHYALTKHADVPYRRWRNLIDFVLPTPDDPAAAPVLSDKCVIGIIGDWGTNEQRSQALLLKLAESGLDLLIHLGDVYYSCSAIEANAFYENVVRGFAGRKMPRVFTLCGNHDMYSGGGPYYALIDRLNQPASFFCLRNSNWQFLAMDTGYNDFDPTAVDTGETWVQDNDDSDDPYSELDWHIDKLKTAGDRRTILLSHHQPFTRNSPIGGPNAINRELLNQFTPYLGQVALWLWGHEHNQVIFDSFQNVQRGRCLGASAIPVTKDQDLYSVDAKFKNPDGSLNQPVPNLVTDSPQIRLQVDPNNDLYNLGYAVLTLNGTAATMQYFQYDSSQNQAIPMYSEDWK